MFVKLVYFLVFTSLGVATLKYRKIVYDWTGQWYWAEKYLGRGGTIVAISLVGLGLIFFGVGYPLGAFDTLKWRWGVVGSAPAGMDMTDGDTAADETSDAPGPEDRRNPLESRDSVITP